MDNKKNLSSNLSIANIYRKSFSLAKSKFLGLFVITFIFLILSYVFINFTLNLIYGRSLFYVCILTFLFFAISSLVLIIMNVIFVHTLGTSFIEENVNIIKSISFSIRRMGKWLRLSGLVFIIIVLVNCLGYFLFYCFTVSPNNTFIIIIPILVLSIIIFIIAIPVICAVVPIMIFENLKPIKALSKAINILKSTHYIKAIRVFLILIILFILILFGGVFTFLFGVSYINYLLPLLGLISTIFSIIFASVSIIVTSSATTETENIETEEYVNRVRVNLGYPHIDYIELKEEVD